MKRITTLLLSLAAIGGVNATPKAAPAQEQGFFSRNFDRAKNFLGHETVDYYGAGEGKYGTDANRNEYTVNDTPANKNARRNARIRRGLGSGVSLAGAGLAASEIAMNRNFLLEFLLNNTGLGQSEKARKFMSHRATKVITSLLEAIALDEIAGAINGQGGRRGFVSGGARDAYGWAKKKWSKKADADAPASSASQQ